MQIAKYVLILFVFLCSPVFSTPQESVISSQTDSSALINEDSVKVIEIYIISICMIILGLLLLHYVTTEVLHLSPALTITLVLLIGLALIAGLQDSIKDLIAGLLIPFETYIEKGYKIDTGEIQGEIIRIGMREIEIKTYDGKQAIIPSHSFLKKPLAAIYTEKENCPVYVDFYLQPTADYERCKEIAYKSTIVSPYLYLNKPVNILLNFRKYLKAILQLL